MRMARTVLPGLLACAALAVPSYALAQLAPGLKAPETKVEAIGQAHSLSCFLAVASRPVPGLNQDMPDNMGEGHFVEKAAPGWLASSVKFGAGTTFSRASSAEGDIWIAFDQASRRCTIAAETADPAAMRTALEQDTFSRGGWKKKKDKSAAGYHHQMALGGLKFLTTYPEIAPDSQVFVVQLATD